MSQFYNDSKEVNVFEILNMYKNDNKSYDISKLIKYI